ncbi:TonB system transport protein TonB [Yersinia enterocolitica]|uniref:TonB system transport protein TonB n=1 Tax=Yersinia enterocolitica TaxID=630 RepID=UPI00022DD138|nr:TonB system transport protein TonB [Yersinia enterocolitica]EHB20051.1 transport protein TonB [Yersinia enterocolitica subsp. palearctica PhRBD_Ye1]EKN3313586.1 TonB system transport protein TonB [Yersinia enterocolitica]EKN3317605.1 TonB system transport protein TonB [Yersinia enterocolitica]EKN3321319.1 TonB system transport protein TonB [Yersinia enterocolitica]EKN3333456.1 TonB system transport protein TonB [Yersinia enterocolitica]
MQLNKFFLGRWLTWPLAFSVGIHGSVIAALLYVSVEQMRIQPEIEDAPIAVTMVNIDTFAAPQPAAAEPQAEPEPEPEPEPIDEAPPEPEVLPEPVPVPIPEPVKPKPKPVKKEVKKPEVKKPDVKKTVAPPDDKPFKSDEPALVSTNAPVKSAPKASVPGVSTSTGPKALSKAKPTYPARALALGVEGQVKVQYDIDENGRVTNVRILEATPRNTFEREVKQVMRKWRFEAVAAKDYVTTVVFKIGGTTEMD